MHHLELGARWETTSTAGLLGTLPHFADRPEKAKTRSARQKGESIKVSDRIRLHVPENQRLHGASGVVVETAEWGAHIHTGAAATGKFRALFSEMIPEARAPVMAVLEGYSGDCCDKCGSGRMKRCGSCLTCESCGSTSGCG